MKRTGYLIGVLWIGFSVASIALSQQVMEKCPLHKQHQAEQKQHQHSEHLKEVNQRGEKAMGFSQSQTTHHFRLFTDGGAIEVEVNDPADDENRNRIQQHLAHIAQVFADGDFETPMAVHAKVPPGVPVMKRLKSEIRYEYQALKSGGRVRISSTNGEARAAIHEFLRFQITDHQTGDSLEIQNP